jgi:hypothetical protein
MARLYLRFGSCPGCGGTGRRYYSALTSEVRGEDPTTACLLCGGTGRTPAEHRELWPVAEVQVAAGVPQRQERHR